jgi:hypothetical protein
MSKLTEGKLMAGGRAVKDWLSDYNDSLENAVRLSAYKVAKKKFADEGFSDSEVKQKAASLAKNLTVNFNRKGEIGGQANALYLFFNAGVQGTASLAHAHFKGKHKYQAWAMSMSMAFLAYQLASMLGGGDEDEYDKLPEHVKARNLVIKSGDGWLKIPIAYGYGFYFNLGRAMADASRKGDYSKLPMAVATSFVEEFTPFGNVVAGDTPDSKQLLYLAPTFAQMFVPPVANRTGMGGTLMPESDFDKSKPDREKMWRLTKGTWSDDLAGVLANVGIDISPETLKHAYRTSTGGAGAMVETIARAGVRKVGGYKEIDTRDTVFQRKFYHEVDVRDTRAAYYKAKQEAETAGEELRRAIKANDQAKVGEIMRERAELIRLDRYATGLQKTVKYLRDYQDQVRASNRPLPEQEALLKSLERQEEDIYNNILKTFKASQQ